MKHISVEAFREVIGVEKDNASIDFVNVCTPTEYKEKHIKGVRNVPLNEIDKHLEEFNTKSTVFIHCRSGNRGRQAIEKLQALGVTAELVNVEGGLLAWDAAGFPTMSLTNRLPLMRQVLLAAGSLVLIGYILSLVVHPQLILLSVFVGAGLTFAGLTGWCGMSYLLAKMPWNK
jgi:rhodanese-related sulfurtransferase